MNPNQVFIGMDLHRSSSSFCVKDREGKILDEKKLKTDPLEIRRYLSSFENQERSLVLEPVSQWHFYADLIEEAGVEVHIANPLRVKAIASARVKTDKIDANVLSDLLRGNLLPEAYFAPKEVRSLREKARLRASLVAIRTEAKNKIHSLLHKNGLTFNYSRLFGKAGESWLKKLILPDCYQKSLSLYLDLIDCLNQSIKKAEKEIRETVKSDPQTTLLTTIPGISFVSAITIMSEIGDIRRFPSAKNLQGFAGLTPSVYASGDSLRRGRITKRGSKWLRWIMIEAAHKQILCKGRAGLSLYYMRMRDLKGTKTAAVATARKLLAVIWRILRDSRPFEERFQVVGRPKMPANVCSS